MSGDIITNAFLIFGKTLVPFIIFSLLISSINQMSQECVGSRKYYEIPALDALKHDRMNRPYQAPRGIFGQFFSDLFAPFRKFNRETGLQTYYGDRSINYFYRKTNDSFGDYASDVFIDSWVWYRQMFFKIAVFLNKVLNIKHLNKGIISKIFLSIPLALIIPYFTEVATLIPIIPCIAGMLGTLIASMRVSIFMKPFIVLLIFIWIIPSFILFWIQYFYSFYLLYVSGIGKKEGDSFSLVLMFLLKKYGFFYIVFSSIFMGLLPFGTEIAAYKVNQKEDDDNDDDDSSTPTPEPTPEPYDFVDKISNSENWASIGLSFFISILGWFLTFLVVWFILSKGFKVKGSLKLARLFILPALVSGVEKDDTKEFNDFPILERYYTRFVKPFEKDEKKS